MIVPITRCSNCVLSTAFPKMQLDQNGICIYCRNEMIQVSGENVIDGAAKKITDLFENRPSDREYDAIMCYSGGKDSTYALMLAVQKYKLKVLAFTLDNCFISPLAFENIQRVVDKIGADQLTIRPSKPNMLAIIRASALKPIYTARTLARISSVCNSCISMVNMYAMKIAIEKRIPFILAGFTLGQIPPNAIVFKNNYDFLKESREDALTRLREHTGNYVYRYFALSNSIVSRIEQYPHNINLLCLEDVTESEIVGRVKQIGWVAPKDVDGCSSNCRLNVFNNHVHQLAFGFNPYELELSHLIRKGLLTRDEALAKIADQPLDQLKLIKGELGLEDKDLEELHKYYA